MKRTPTHSAPARPNMQKKNQTSLLKKAMLATGLLICGAAMHSNGQIVNVGGSSTSNYVTKWQTVPPGTPVTIQNSLMYDNGTGVGIGTTNPQSLLDVEANLTPASSLVGIISGMAVSSTTYDVTGLSISSTSSSNSGSAKATGIVVNTNSSGSSSGKITGISSTVTGSATTSGDAMAYYGNVAATQNNAYGLELVSSTSSGSLSVGVKADVTSSPNTSTAYGFWADNIDGGPSGGTTYGVYGATSGGGTGDNYYGVYGATNGGGTNNNYYGGYFTTGCGGTTNTYYAVYGSANAGCGGTGNTYWAAYFNGAAGCTANAWTLSDVNLKQNIQPMTGALDKLMKLQPKTYDFRVNDYPGLNFDQAHQMGLIAQDVEQVFPNLVKQAGLPEQKDSKGNVINKAYSFKMMNYTGLIPVVISAVQEQQNTIIAQQAENQKLQNTVNDLQNKYNTLLAEVEQLKAQSGAIQGNNVAPTGDQPSLSQNTPNPFAQNTVINYYLPAATPNATINIRSITGTVLQSFNVTTAGHGQITVNAGTLAPATYVYDMTINGKTVDSKKMMIIGQ